MTADYCPEVNPIYRERVRELLWKDDCYTEVTVLLKTGSNM